MEAVTAKQNVPAKVLQAPNTQDNCPQPFIQPTMRAYSNAMSSLSIVADSIQQDSMVPGEESHLNSATSPMAFTNFVPDIDPALQPGIMSLPEISFFEDAEILVNPIFRYEPTFHAMSTPPLEADKAPQANSIPNVHNNASLSNSNQESGNNEPTSVPTIEQLNGRDPIFAITPVPDFTPPTLEELDPALIAAKRWTMRVPLKRTASNPSEDSTQRNGLIPRPMEGSSASSGPPLATLTSSYGVFGYTTPSSINTSKIKLPSPSKFSTGMLLEISLVDRKPNVPPRKELQNLLPASDLIRDAVEPHPDDHSEGALIYRIATCPRGRTTNFTFTEHYGLLRTSLHAQLVHEMNRKLSTGLELGNIPLLRDLVVEEMNEEFAPVVQFAKTGLQTKIDWTICCEHLKVLECLDMGKPELDLEEMDRLVRATGVWVFERCQKELSVQERETL